MGREASHSNDIWIAASGFGVERRFDIRRIVTVLLVLAATGFAMVMGGCDRAGPSLEARNTLQFRIELYIGFGDGDCCPRERTIHAGGSAGWNFTQHLPDDVLTYKAYDVVSVVVETGTNKYVRRNRPSGLVYCFRASERQILDGGGVLTITRNVPRGIFDRPADPCPEAAVYRKAGSAYSDSRGWAEGA